MKYSEEGDTITIQMSRDEYDGLLVMMGAALGVAKKSGHAGLFWTWVDFANRMNSGNPKFKQYDIPDEYRTHADRT